MRDWLAEWIERVFDFFCLTGTPRELPEDSYAHEQEAQHRRDLAEFDSVLKRECGIIYLPWEEQRPSNAYAGWNAILRPGLSAMMQQQQQLPALDYQRLMQSAINQRTGMYDQQLGQHQSMMGQLGDPLGGINNLLGGLLGSQSRPSRPE